MKRFVNIILIFCALSSCAQNNVFPDNINTTKTNDGFRIKGTGVFFQPREGFEYIKQMARYQKNEKLYLQVVETNTNGFSKVKQGLTRQAIEAKGAKVDVIKNVKFNQFDAIYIEGPSKFPGETKISLFFGGENFVVMIVGVCKTDDGEGKKELQDLLKSAYYDDSSQIDPFELADFEFDNSITNFKYVMTASNLYRYAENGERDNKNDTANSFEIGSFGKTPDDAAPNLMNNIIASYERNGVEFKNKTIVKTKINGFNSYVLQSEMTLSGKTGIMYMVIMMRDKTTVAFMGNAFNDTDNYLNKFKRTVESIKDK
ncbi:MAG: hypothetical protein JST50_01950 [Bacteroidetes bacterium]|jgi:hypothetical protein|nr:hypothetical protein [Bacteroidota bacterium]